MPLSQFKEHHPNLATAFSAAAYLATVTSGVLVTFGTAALAAESASASQVVGCVVMGAGAFAAIAAGGAELIGALMP